MTEPAIFIFDMDGTIVDNMKVHERVWIDMLGESGVQISAEEFHLRASGKTTRQILREMIGDHLSDREIAEYAERKESLYRTTYAPHMKPLNGLVDFLEEADEIGVPMALATSAYEKNIQFVLGGTGLESYFNAVVGAEEVKRGKPHPEMFLLAARKLDAPVSSCLVFEDSLAGLEAVHRAGMKAVAVATTRAPGELRGLRSVISVINDFSSLKPGSLLELFWKQ